MVLTPAELAAHLRTSERTVSRMVAEGCPSMMVGRQAAARRAVGAGRFTPGFTPEAQAGRVGCAKLLFLLVGGAGFEPATPAV